MKVAIDGREYVLPETFTYREAGIIKRLAGVRAREIRAALAAGDMDVVVALAVIAKRRAGEAVNEDAILDSELGTIVLVGETPDEEEATTTSPSEAADAAAPQEA